MTTSMEKRLEALESQSDDVATARQVSTAELQAILAPLFGGRVPTHGEMQSLVESEPKGVGHGNP